MPSFSSILKDRSWWVDILFLLILLGCLDFVLLGSRPLFVPDEGRYAEIAREMLVRHDYLTPHLNGIKYFEKPILFYWLSAFAIKIGGLNLWSLRSVNAILSILGCLATYLTARLLYGRVTGLLSAMILGTSLLYFIMSHMISLDLPVTVFLAICLYSFLLATRTSGKTFYWLSAIFAGLAILTKGLIGLVFPGMIIIIWLFLLRDWQALKRIPWWSSIVIFLAIVLPWHILVSIKNPEFPYFYLIEQHFLRYSTLEVGHYQPIWYFIPWLLLGFFPWILFLPKATYQQVPKKWNLLNDYKSELYFLIWALTIFLFFSFSKSKLIPYILPVFPPLAILTARYLSKMNIKYLLIILIAQIVSLLFLVTILPFLDTRTIQPLATVLNAYLRPDDEVVTYNQYYQDLPFYLQRQVSILNWRNELSYGMQHQSGINWLWNDSQFWQHWHSKQRVFVFISDSEFQKIQSRHKEIKFFCLARTANTVLMSNQQVHDQLNCINKKFDYY